MDESQKNTGIEEEIVDNQPTGFEKEFAEDEETSSDSEPYNPEKIRVECKFFSIGQVLEMISDEDLELAPEFQRLRVWSPKQKTRLIESLLLRIPLPAFYFAADRKGHMHVIDGLQRLSTIFAFVHGEQDRKYGDPFTIKEGHLQYLKDLGSSSFNELDVVWRRRIKQAQIVVNVIDPQTPENAKMDIFSRINTGGSPLTPQEMRHCISGKRSRAFLAELAEMDAFKEVIGSLYKGRMADREMILRFCAFRLTILKNWHWKNIDQFLNDTVALIDDPIKMPDEKLDELRRDFKKAMIAAKLVFGEHAFRKWPSSQNNRNPVNKPLFETQAVTLADYELDDLENYKENIRTRFEYETSRLTDFERALTTGTQSKKNIQIRFQKCKDFFEDAIS